MGQINNNLSTPLRIHSVRVEGAENTRNSFIGFLVKPLIPAAEGSNVEAVLHATRRISEVLQQADIFGSVDARLERARDVLSSPRDVDVVVKAKEKGRFFVKSATEFGNNEGSAVCCSSLSLICSHTLLEHHGACTERFWRRGDVRSECFYWDNDEAVLPWNTVGANYA